MYSGKRVVTHYLGVHGQTFFKVDHSDMYLNSEDMLYPISIISRIGYQGSIVTGSELHPATKQKGAQKVFAAYLP